MDEEKLLEIASKNWKLPARNRYGGEGKEIY
jgi:hypothetical protein